MTGVDIDELDTALTTGPRQGRESVHATARIGFTAAGTAEPRQMTVRIGYALAAATGAPVRVADQLMAPIGVPSFYNNPPHEGGTVAYMPQISLPPSWRMPMSRWARFIISATRFRSSRILCDLTPDLSPRWHGLTISALNSEGVSERRRQAFFPMLSVIGPPSGGQTADDWYLHLHR